MKLLLGARWEGHAYQAKNVIGFLDRVEKILPGFRGVYDGLSEFAHPNYSGVALAFSKPKGEYGVELGAYPRDKSKLSSQAVAALMGGIELYCIDYNSTAEYLHDLVQICYRDLETNIRFEE